MTRTLTAGAFGNRLKDDLSNIGEVSTSEISQAMGRDDFSSERIMQELSRQLLNIGRAGEGVPVHQISGPIQQNATASNSSVMGLINGIRGVVGKEFLRRKTGLSIDEIVAKVEKSAPDMGNCSVGNITEALQELGIPIFSEVTTRNPVTTATNLFQPFTFLGIGNERTQAIQSIIPVQNPNASRFSVQFSPETMTIQSVRAFIMTLLNSAPIFEDIRMYTIGTQTYFPAS